MDTEVEKSIITKRAKKLRLKRSSKLYHDAKRQATPRWRNVEFIARLYSKAKTLSQQTNKKFSVDYIIPLRHKYVCGLHVHTNLTVITESSNSRKGNSL